MNDDEEEDKKSDDDPDPVTIKPKISVVQAVNALNEVLVWTAENDYWVY